MRLQGRAVKRVERNATGITIATLALLTASSPAWAIETGGSQLPPPPPPPLSAAPPGAAAPAPAPRAAAKPLTTPASSNGAGDSATANGGTSGASASASVTYAGASQPADEAPDSGPHAFDTRWFVAPMLGFASQYMNFGIGVRGGKVLDNHIYIGGTFLYSLGQGGTYSVVAPNGVVSSASWSTSSFYLGPEGGYDFDLRYVVVRPYMGLGVFSWPSAAGPAAGGSTNNTQVVAWPGCTVIWPVPHSDFFLGGDLRVVTVPGGSVGFYALGGLHFGS